MKSPLTVTPADIRRINITRQRLTGERPKPTAEGLVEMILDIGCVQIDPISAVARTNHLVPWSRLGVYDLAIWDQVLFKDRSAFEYFAHAAAIVATQDYPIFSHTMRKYQTGTSANALYIRKWLSDNQALLDSVMSALELGPINSKDFEEKAAVSWKSSGWTNDKNITRLLDFLWVQGIIMVSDRKGLTRFWDLSQRVLPEWTPRQELSTNEVMRKATQRAIHSLGIARKRDIIQYYTRSRYENLPGILNELEKEELITQVKPEGEGVAGNKKWAKPWYILTDDIPLLEQIRRGEWEGRTTLLSPFDNLIADRARTELLWDYDFRIEIYVPKDKRKYGYYTLSILHDDRIIGRVDSQMDRKAMVYNVNNVYAEPNAPLNRATGKAIAGAIQDLATFLGAKEIVYGENVPEGWKKDLR